eukprot:scaffold219482_cov35-Tisochrysis_lutea.AAC.2
MVDTTSVRGVGADVRGRLDGAAAVSPVHARGACSIVKKSMWRSNVLLFFCSRVSVMCVSE